MRSSLLLSAAALGLLAGAFAPAYAQNVYAQNVYAQNSVGSTQSPPSPNASAQGPQPVNSVPAGSATSGAATPGANLGTTGTPATTTMGTTMAAPMARPATTARSRMSHSGVKPGRMAPAAMVGDASADPAAPPTSAYRGGAGSPYSTQASNTGASNTRSVVAPRLPSPEANTPEALLATAQRALDRGRTGEAQEALERAETRVLSRTTDPSMAGTPDSAAMVRHIGDARRALGARNMPAARAAVAAAMAAPIPARGPTVDTTVIQTSPPTPVLGAPPMAPRTY